MVKKKAKKKSGFEENIEKKRIENPEFNYPEKLDVKGIKYIREDFAVKYANSIPEEVTENFLIKRNKRCLWKPWTFLKPAIEEFKPKGNLLLLLDNEGNIRIYDKVQSGYFKFNDELEEVEGSNNNTKYLILKPNKLRSIIFDDEKNQLEEKWQGWVCDVNSAIPYPHAPEYDCEDVSQAINRAISGNRAFARKEEGGSFWKFLPWMIGIIGFVYVAYLAITKNLFGLGDLVGYGKSAVDTAVNSGAVNITSAVPGGTITG